MSRPDRVPTNAAVVRRHKPWTIRNNTLPSPGIPAAKNHGLTRRYEVTWINNDGQIDNFLRVGPAIPIFEQAFSAFSHGAMISTIDGPVSVEDLEPGQMIETANGTFEPLRWIGAMTLIPGAPTNGDVPQKLYRITADALGLARPATDVTFGPAARILNRDPAIRAALGAEAALAPISSFEDGMGVIALNPVAPVRVYHLALDTHQVIRAGGVDVESYHPGPDAHYSMSTELRSVFLSMFPHLDSLQGFGRVIWPRFEAQDGTFEIV